MNVETTSSREGDVSKARLAFRLAKDFDKAAVAAGDSPDEYPELVIRDMIERMLHWCDVHKVSFDEELEAGRDLYKERPE
jgi:hypothetical protein